MKAEIKPIREWVEKAKGYPEGYLRIYVGSMLIGYAEPVRDELEELFHFTSVTEIVHSEHKRRRGLEELKEDVELDFKDFLNKIVK